MSKQLTNTNPSFADIARRWTGNKPIAEGGKTRVLIPPVVHSRPGIYRAFIFLLTACKHKRCVIIVDPDEQFVPYATRRGRVCNLLALFYLYLVGYFTRPSIVLRTHHDRPDDNTIGRVNAKFEREWTRHFRWNCDLSIPQVRIRIASEASAELNLDVPGLVKYTTRELLKHSPPFGSFLFMLSEFDEIKSRRA